MKLSYLALSISVFSSDDVRQIAPEVNRRLVTYWSICEQIDKNKSLINGKQMKISSIHACNMRAKYVCIFTNRDGEKCSENDMFEIDPKYLANGAWNEFPLPLLRIDRTNYLRDFRSGVIRSDLLVSDISTSTKHSRLLKRKLLEKVMSQATW